MTLTQFPLGGSVADTVSVSKKAYIYIFKQVQPQVVSYKWIQQIILGFSFEDVHKYHGLGWLYSLNYPDSRF